jgi:4-coumarate--CoA ligase
MYTMVMKSFVLDDFLHLCSKTRANTMRIFPTTALAISKMPRFDGFCLEDVRYILCSGAPLQNDVIRALHEKLNAAPIFQGYG